MDAAMAAKAYLADKNREFYERTLGALGDAEIMAFAQAFLEAQAKVEALTEALRKIAALKDATETRGDDIELAITPPEAVRPGGWIPLHPRTRQGLLVAAKMAEAALVEAGKTTKAVA